MPVPGPDPTVGIPAPCAVVAASGVANESRSLRKFAIFEGHDKAPSHGGTTMWHGTARVCVGMIDEGIPMSYRLRSRDEHLTADGPKRILSLDGGGLRGVLALGFLARIESLLRDRHGSGRFRLAHYFDLIAGTSTGAIIAAALAKGLTVEEIAESYMRIGRQVFKRNWFRKGILRARYDEAELVVHLKRVLDAGTRLGDSDVQTGLLIVTKRVDTGSPWPLGNNPAGRYFRAKETDTWISNADYPLWKVVRASTAAPSFFDAEKITIAREAGRRPVVGEFVDGGVSPFNNPSLQAFMYATLKGYRVGWETGADRLLLVSVGTGAADPAISPSRLAAQSAVKSLMGLMDDCAALVETMMQWMSESPTAHEIDRELKKLEGDLLGGAPLLTYQRYNVSLTPEDVRPLMPGLDRATLDSLPKMDVPENLETLRELGELAAQRQVTAGHFPHQFDLPA